MALFVLINESQIYDWQKFCILRLQQEYGNVSILRTASIILPKCGILKKIQNRIEDRFSPVSQNKVDIKQELPQCLNAPQDGDIILDLVGNLSQNDFATSIKIWCPMYNGQHLAQIRNIGEYEIINKSATFYIQLCENGNVIETAKYNPHYSAVRNWKIATYSLHWLVLKCLRNNFFRHQGIIQSTHSTPEYRYVISFYRNILDKFVAAYANKLFGYYRERWTVGLSKGSYIEDGINNIKIIPEPKGEFWADPFLFHHKRLGKTVLFIERFPFKDKKGVISCAEVTPDLSICGMHDILVRDYHFSYPHVIEEDGQLYMMPESSANKQLEIYRCVSFPDRWELFATALHGERVADTVYYRDKNGDSWLFLTYCDSSIDLHCTLLMIYKVDSIQLNTLIPHKKNPILINSTCARNGGRIYEENGKIYRVSQDNSHRMYGHGISVHEIQKLNLEDYEEVLIRHTEGQDLPEGIGTHQMCQIENMFVIDIRKK